MSTEALVEVFEISKPEVLELLVTPPTAVDGVRKALEEDHATIDSRLAVLGDIRVTGCDKAHLEHALEEAHIGHVTEWHTAA
jgi:hypothetical protein